jgi:formylglycine-generating enzyme required for sulfatase activity
MKENYKKMILIFYAAMIGISAYAQGTWKAAGTKTTINAATEITTVSNEISISTSQVNLNYNKGNGPSAQQNFTVSGSELTNDITITPSTNIQISKTSGSGFTNSPITLTQSSGNVSSTLIYTRLKAGLGSGSYADSILITSTGKTTKKVICSGTVVGPIISVIETALNGFSYTNNSGPSNMQTISISGIQLEDNVIVTPPINYEISTDNSTYSISPITLVPTSGSLESTTIYVRLKSGLSEGSYNENISFQSTNADSKNVSCSGVVLMPLINVSSTSLTGINYIFDNGPSDEQSFTVSGTGLVSDVVINVGSSYQITTESGGLFTSSISLTPTLGTLNTTTIYVRLKSSLNIGNYSDVISLSSTSATSKTITCSGKVGYITGYYPTISFTASGVTSSVGSVLVQNLTTGTVVTVPNGNTLTLTDKITSIEEPQSANNAGIWISQDANSGKSTLTFYAKQAGSAQVTTYAIDGRKVVELITRLEVGNNSLELSLPTGMYVIRVSGTGYTYSTKLQSQGSTANQAEIKFLSNKKVEASAPQKTKAMLIATTNMNYTTGDQLIFTATSGAYIASVPDVPNADKTINFVFSTIPTSAIPAGTFIMGSPVTEVGRGITEIQHSVTLTAFRMSKYEITNAQYAAFLNAKNIGSDGLYAAGAYPGQPLIYVSTVNYDWGLHYTGTQWIPVTGCENYPVINVTWYGAKEYATYIGGTLPTESQWEYACRAGTTTTFNTGNFLTNLQANYYWGVPYNGGTNTVKNSPGKTQLVGSYAPNAYGLYDMHGNVSEWCADWNGSYPTTPQTNPTGAASDSYRICRIGSWRSNAADTRSAGRGICLPNGYASNIGFRVALVP